MGLSEREVGELRRVLAAFKAELPPHELGSWHVEIAPHNITVEDERTNTIVGMRVGFGYAKAEAECVRCGRRFQSQSQGQYWVSEEGEHANAVAKAKEAAQRDADRHGPCWGDVPKPPREPQYATLDEVAAKQEP